MYKPIFLVCRFIPNFFLLLLLSFYSPFLFSLSSTFYPLSIHWKKVLASALRKTWKWNIDQLGDLGYFTTNFVSKIGQSCFSGIALPEFGRYSNRTHIWMDLSLLSQLLIKTICCHQKMMTSQVVQCLGLKSQGKSTFAVRELKQAMVKLRERSMGRVSGPPFSSPSERNSIDWQTKFTRKSCHHHHYHHHHHHHLHFSP